MAKDLHNDNLEDLFKDALDNDISSSGNTDSWDVPSDQVWEGIDQQLRPEEKERPLFFWLFNSGIGYAILFSIVLLVLSVLFFNHLNKNKTSNLKEASISKSESSKIIEHNERQSVLSTPPTTTNKSVTKHSKNNDLTTGTNLGSTIKNDIDNPTASTLPSANSYPIQKPENSTNKTSSNKTSSDNPPPVKNNNLEISNETHQPGSDAGINVTNIDTTQETSIPKSEIESSSDSFLILKPRAINALPIKGLPILTPDLSISTIDTLQPIAPFTDLATQPGSNRNDDKQNNKGFFYVNLTIGPNIGTRQINSLNGFTLQRQLNQQEEHNLTWKAGLGLGYQINSKFGIETGLSYASLQLNHSINRQIRYSLNGESLNTSSGEFEKSYDFELKTSSGDVPTDIVLSRSSNTNIVENDFIRLSIQGNQQHKFLSIPLLATYTFGKNNWHFYLKSGIINRFLIDSEFTITSINSTRPGIRTIANDRTFRSRKISPDKNFLMDFSIGAGLKYRINNHLSLIAEPSFSRSIIPIFKNNFIETRLTFTALDLGLRYDF